MLLATALANPIESGDFAIVLSATRLRVTNCGVLATPALQQKTLYSLRTELHSQQGDWRISSMKGLIGHIVVAALTVGLAFVGCGSDSGGGGDSSGGDGAGGGAGGGACSSTGDCTGGTVCVVVAGNSGTCMPQCSGSANDCGVSSVCSGIGAVSVNICQAPPTANDPPKAEEEPRIPCVSDAECEALQAGTICAEFGGHKDCTIPCSVESDCDTPGLAGVSVDILTCIPDEAMTSRNACLPDEACFTNILSCMTFPGGGGGDLDAGGTCASDDDCGTDETCETFTGVCIPSF